MFAEEMNGMVASRRDVLRAGLVSAGGVLAAGPAWAQAAGPSVGQGVAVPGQDAAQGLSPVVVELYTSQGCSSCPPADRMLTQMIDNPQVLPLSLHVDYWDYLGWKDGLADPMFTRRQKAYARAQGSRMVYTPQMVVDGQGFVKGAHEGEVAEEIARARLRPKAVRLEVEPAGPGVHHLRALPAPDLAAGPMQVTLVHYLPHKQVEILRGENAGARIDYVNIVTFWRPVAEWDGRAPLEMLIEPVQDRPAAVLIQRAGLGPIEAAARLP